jgi:hypothetical protein
MLRILESLLALVTLLLMAFVAAKANSAPLPTGGEQWQSPPVAASAAAAPHRYPCHRCLTPGPQPGTYLRGQPFAYGYFGAHPPTTAAYHRNSRNDWYQWTFSRGD